MAMHAEINNHIPSRCFSCIAQQDNTFTRRFTALFGVDSVLLTPLIGLQCGSLLSMNTLHNEMTLSAGPRPRSGSRLPVRRGRITRWGGERTGRVTLLSGVCCYASSAQWGRSIPRLSVNQGIEQISGHVGVIWGFSWMLWNQTVPLTSFKKKEREKKREWKTQKISFFSLILNVCPHSPQFM